MVFKGFHSFPLFAGIAFLMLNACSTLRYLSDDLEPYDEGYTFPTASAAGSAAGKAERPSRPLVSEGAWEKSPPPELFIAPEGATSPSPSPSLLTAEERIPAAEERIPEASFSPDPLIPEAPLVLTPLIPEAAPAGATPIVLKMPEMPRTPEIPGMSGEETISVDSVSADSASAGEPGTSFPALPGIRREEFTGAVAAPLSREELERVAPGENEPLALMPPSPPPLVQLKEPAVTSDEGIVLKAPAPGTPEKSAAGDSAAGDAAILSLLGSFVFAPDSSRLPEEGHELIKEVAETHPKDDSMLRIVLYPAPGMGEKVKEEREAAIARAFYKYGVLAKNLRVVAGKEAQEGLENTAEIYMEYK